MLPLVSAHHHPAEFRAVAKKAPAARREYSLQEKSPERSIFNVVVSRLVLRRVEAIADGGGGSEEVLPSPSSTLVPHVVLPSSLLCLLALQWEKQRYPE